MLKIDSLWGLLAVNAWLRLSRLRWRGVRIGWGSWIKSRVTLGRGTATGGGFVVRGDGRLRMGRYCAVGESVRIITSNHDIAYLSINLLVQDRVLGKRMLADKRDVIVGNDVWIGDGVIILPGAVIGDGAVIGAGAVVTRAVAPFTVVGGNPAKVLKERFPPQVVERIARLAWWQWPEDEQRRKAFLFAQRCDTPDALKNATNDDDGGAS